MVPWLLSGMSKPRTQIRIPYKQGDYGRSQSRCLHHRCHGCETKVLCTAHGGLRLDRQEPDPFGACETLLRSLELNQVKMRKCTQSNRHKHNNEIGKQQNTIGQREWKSQEEEKEKMEHHSTHNPTNPPVHPWCGGLCPSAPRSSDKVTLFIPSFSTSSCKPRRIHDWRRWRLDNQ
jgi:hypothetical protein